MDFQFSDDATPSQKITLLNAIIFNLEMAIYFVTMFILFPFAITLLRTRAFNVNLRIILFDLHISLAILLITRYIIVYPLLYAYYLDEDISSPILCWLAKTFHDICIYGFGCIVWTICIERSLASYFVEIYEYKMRYVGWFAVLFKWFISVSCVTLDQLFGTPITGKDQNCLPCQREYNSSIGLAVGCLGIVISAIVGLVISENVQMSRVLFPLMFALLIQTLLGTLWFLLGLVFGYYKMLGYNWAKTIMMDGYEFSQSFDILMAIYTLSIPLICIIKHPALKRRYICIAKVLPILNQKEAPIKYSEPIIDSALQLNRYQATDVYFINLEKSWEQSYKLMAGITEVED